VADLGVPLYVGTAQLLQQITGFHVHRGALAAMARRPLREVADVLPGCTRVVVLEDVNSHTNVGAIFRCAAGLGMDAVLLSPSCADPLYRRSVRASMGEVFAVPYARCRGPRAECPDRSGGAGAGPDPDGGRRRLAERRRGGGGGLLRGRAPAGENVPVGQQQIGWQAGW
jgi:tRNA G18 (ribose-2'-O)-methylase SpoU